MATQNGEELAVAKSVTNSNDWLEAIRMETVNRTVQAKQLIQPHFPEHDVNILSSHPAPGGALVVTASIDNNERTFVVLADNKNFVEGVLNSPYLNSQTVSSKHTKLTQMQAKVNSETSTSFEALKADFKAEPAMHSKTLSQPKTNHLNAQQINEAFVMPEVSTSVPQATKRDLLEETMLLDSIVFGQENAPSIYVYFDFNCPACLQSHKPLEKLIKEGLIKVHYIPVGVQNKESIVKTAYSLIPEENSKRQIVFNHMMQQKPIEELLPNKANEIELKVGLIRTFENKKTFTKLPNPATPTFLYRHNDISYISVVNSTADIKKIVRLLNNK
jgi:hypothetical protein